MKYVILTGAGVSAESGLGTFRDKGGLWAKYDLNEVATPQGFARDPSKVHDFYNARRANAAAALPNPAHHALARLGQALGDRLTLVTQNVDDLHERAGSTGVIHMHGRLDRARCATCTDTWPAPAIMQATDPCPTCGSPTTRPDIVWFGEIPRQVDDIMQALGDCDVFVAIGTSGTVWPAAGFVNEAAASGARTLEMNLDLSAGSGGFGELRLGPAGEVVPVWVDEVLSGQWPDD